ncbi:HNH endonuclease signature motif containing protein [Georgenia thermotolerans]|nr:HNH endonuclease signature motif containing protein [Georgenia thermotolerans]
MDEPTGDRQPDEDGAADNEVCLHCSLGVCDKHPDLSHSSEVLDQSHLKPLARDIAPLFHVDGPPGADRKTVAALREMPPGPRLAAVLEGIDLASVDDYVAVEVIAGYHRMEAWAAARTAEAAAQLASRDVMFPLRYDPDTSRRDVNVAAEELSMRMGLTRPESRRLISVGAAFDGVMAPTAEALEAGLIDWRKAATIITTLDHQPAPVAWAVQEEVLPRAPFRSHPQVVRDLNKALIAVDHHDADHRQHRASARRHVQRLTPLPDGQAAMRLVGPAHELIALDLAAEAGARAAKGAGDSRTTDQLRFDTLVTLAQHALVTGWAGTPPDGSAAPASATGATGPAPTTPADDPAPPGAADPFPGWPGPAMRLSPAHIQVRLTVPLSVALPPEDDDDGGGRREPVGVGATVSDAAVAATTGSPPPGGDPPGAAPPPETAPGTTPPRDLAPGTASPSDPPPGNAPEPATTSDLVPACDLPTAEVAELDGYGPITPAVARALAAGGTWRRIVTDPLSGAVLDVGRTTYRPPADLVRHLAARDRGCVSPTCQVPPGHCQIDHTMPWSQGGPTADWNTELLCGREHLIKTCGAFKLAQPTPGTFVWTTPTGHRYHLAPDGTVTPLAPPDDPPPF